MSNDEAEDKLFFVDRAKQGRAACKGCKSKCEVGEFRIAKNVPSPFGSGKMKNWYHADCIFQQFLKQRLATKRIESPEDIDGWDALNPDDQCELLQKIDQNEKDFATKHGKNYVPKQSLSVKASSNNGTTSNTKEKKNATPVKIKTSDDTVQPTELYFREFRHLVSAIAKVDSYIEKTNIVKNFFKTGFKGDVAQWCRLLLPGVVKRIYNLQNKQLIKLFSKIFAADLQAMTDSLNRGDIGETIESFFDSCTTFKRPNKSIILLQEVDDFLEELSHLTKEDDQLQHFQYIAHKCTPSDLKVIVRLIKHDLRMNAGAKHILQGIHSDAYEAYQASRDLNAVVKRFTSSAPDGSGVNSGIKVMTAVQPMLAEACKSIEQAMKKCPNGIFSEIKYDGERVQVHKHGTQYKYYSRSLKPVLHHKIALFERYIPEAFPQSNDLILDSEILMMDLETNQPLPFGTLGIHKKSEFQNACACLFVFDCIYYNGESLIQKPLDYRKKVLKDNMKEIPNRIVLAEIETIKTAKQLASMVARVLGLGLEGLVLKDIKSAYEPGKRHWLKIKKDYLLDGSMADTADLVVLGAWYGTGRKAGKKSVFLMGCYDKNTNQFCTVTKVHTGHDDKTLEQLQTELQMDEIQCNYARVPNWLNCNKPMTPDFVSKDPKKSPVWEITGAEFTQHDVHTADGISIRFPRVTRIRIDKTWETATTLNELKNLFKTSKERTDYATLMNVSDEVIDDKIVPQHKTEKIGTKRKIDGPKPSISPKIPKTAHTVVSPNKTSEPNLNLFKGIKLLLEDGAKEIFANWLKSFVEYGGRIVKPNDHANATHVLHLEKMVIDQTMKCPKQAAHIVLDWIRDSISNNELQKLLPYTVRWKPL